MSKAVNIGSGTICPKCRGTMRRYTHPPGWAPRSGQPYHFGYWDRCIICRHVQHYEEAKVWAEPQAKSDLTPAQQKALQAIKTVFPHMVEGERRRWLAEQLGIEQCYASIADFDEVECETVIEICASG